MPVNTNKSVYDLLSNATPAELKIIAGALSPYVDGALNDPRQVMFLKKTRVKENWDRIRGDQLIVENNNELSNLLSKYGLADLDANGNVIRIHPSLGTVNSYPAENGQTITMVIPPKGLNNNPFDSIAALAAAKITNENYENYLKKLDDLKKSGRLYIVKCEEVQPDGTVIERFVDAEVDRIETDKERDEKREAGILQEKEQPYELQLKPVEPPKILQDSVEKTYDQSDTGNLIEFGKITGVGLDTAIKLVRTDSPIVSPAASAASAVLSLAENSSIMNMTDEEIEKYKNGSMGDFEAYDFTKSLYYTLAISVKNSNLNKANVNARTELPADVKNAVGFRYEALRVTRFYSNTILSLGLGAVELGKGIVDGDAEKIGKGLSSIQRFFDTEILKVPGITSMGNAVGQYMVTGRISLKFPSKGGPLTPSPNPFVHGKSINNEILRGKKYQNYVENLSKQWQNVDSKKVNIFSGRFQYGWYLVEYGPKASEYLYGVLASIVDQNDQIKEIEENGLNRTMYQITGGRLRLKARTVSEIEKYWTILDPSTGKETEVRVPMGLVSFINPYGDLNGVIRQGKYVEISAEEPTFWEKAIAVLTRTGEGLAEEYVDIYEGISNGFQWVLDRVKKYSPHKSPEVEKENAKARELEKKFEEQNKIYESLSDEQKKRYLQENPEFKKWKNSKPLESFNGFKFGSPYVNSNAALAMEVEVAKKEFDSMNDILKSATSIADQYQSGDSNVPNVALQDINSNASFATNVDGLTNVHFTNNTPEIATSIATPTCFSGEVKVSTKKGELKISEIEIGDFVLSFNSDGIIRENIVVQKFKHYDQKIYRYELSNGEYLDSTENHPVLTENGLFVEIGKLSNGDRLVDINNKPVDILSKYFLKNDDVYNLEVNVDNTYIANKIRVHNKTGHSYQQRLISETLNDIAGIMARADEERDQYEEWLKSTFPGVLESGFAPTPNIPTSLPVYTPTPRKPRRRPRPDPSPTGTPTGGPPQSTGFARVEVPTGTMPNENYVYENSPVARYVGMVPTEIT